MIYVPVNLPDTQPISTSTVQCAIAAASAVGIAPDLLLAVRSTEQGRSGYAVCNKNGTCDFGEAAINTIKLPEVVQMGFSPVQAIADGCYAMQLKAHILRQHLSRHSAGTSLLATAARYNSKTPSYNLQYQAKLTPWLSAWGCALATNYHSNPNSHYSYPPQALFVVASGLIPSSMQTCPTVATIKK